MRRHNLSFRIAIVASILSVVLSPLRAQTVEDRPRAVAPLECAACVDAQQQLESAREAYDRAQQQYMENVQDQKTLQGQIAEERDKVKALKTKAAAKNGNGGSAFDPDTGLTTDAVFENGRLKVTVKDADGNPVGEPVYKPLKLYEPKEQQKKEEQYLSRLEKLLDEVRAEGRDALQEWVEAERNLRRAQEAVDVCIRKCDDGDAESHLGRNITTGVIVGVAIAASVWGLTHGGGAKVPSIPGITAQPAQQPTPLPQPAPAAQPAPPTQPAPAPPPPTTVAATPVATPPEVLSPNTVTPQDAAGNYQFVAMLQEPAQCSLVKNLKGTLVVTADSNNASAVIARLVVTGMPTLATANILQRDGSVSLLFRVNDNGNVYSIRLNGMFARNRFEGTMEWTVTSAANDAGCSQVRATASAVAVK